MIPVMILHEAEVELREAVAYYEEKNPGLGLDLEVRLSGLFGRFATFQNGCWPLREDGTRRYLTHRFPYLVIYAYLKDRIWLIAIAHCKRRPGYWKDRIKAAEPADER